MYLLTSVLMDMTVFDHDMCARLRRIQTELPNPSEDEVHNFVEQELHDLVTSPFETKMESSPEDVRYHVPLHTRIYQSLRHAIGVS